MGGPENERIDDRGVRDRHAGILQRHPGLDQWIVEGIDEDRDVDDEVGDRPGIRPGAHGGGREKDPQPLIAEWSDKLPGVRWVADPENVVARELSVRGAPTLIGVNGTEVKWVLAGVLNDPAMVRDVVRSWILP